MLRARSPIEDLPKPEPGVEPEDADVVLTERPLVSMIDLRGDPENRDFMAAAGRVLDLVLPTQPNTIAQKGDLTVFWMAPDEWLLIGPHENADKLIAQLREAFAGLHASCCESGDSRVVLRLSGRHARDVLNKGSPLDLHPRTFPVDTISRAHLAKVEAILHLVDDQGALGSTWDLYVHRSIALYTWQWLREAGREFGIRTERSY